MHIRKNPNYQDTIEEELATMLADLRRLGLNPAPDRVARLRLVLEARRTRRPANAALGYKSRTRDPASA